MATMIAPSMLSADFGNLERDIEMINKSKAHLFHLDIMDGVFVHHYNTWCAVQFICVFIL